jgi:hypothetical protein
MNKLFIYQLLLLITLVSCTKETSLNQRLDTDNISQKIKDIAITKLNNIEINNFDWEKPITIKTKNDSSIVLIPSKINSNYFIISRENMTSIEVNLINIIKISSKELTIINKSLNNNTIVTNNVLNGKVIENNKSVIKNNLSTEKKSMVSNQYTLPDAVVTAYISTNYSYIDFYSLYWIFNQNILYIDLYIPSSSFNTAQYVISNQVAYEIDFDDRLTRQAASIQKMKNCLDANIPSNGATYDVELCADIPINGNPNINVFLDKPGHAFLQITKTNGSASLSRSFGFYPKDQYSSLTLDPVESVILEDNLHAYDAKIRMSLTETQYNQLMNYSINLANNTQYDLNNYNCVNFALDCFNSVLSSGNKISAPNIPIGYITNGKTPASLYSNLVNMKNSNYHNLASNITIATSLSSSSSGQCN